MQYGRCVAIDTGVVESSIEPAISLDGKIDHGRDLSLVRNVARYGENVVTFPT
jgi:hypothetical protein